MDKFILGLDLGQLHDYTALSIVQVIKGPPKSYALGHLERFPLGTLYRDIVERVREEMLLLPGDTDLVIDATGVGAGIVELFEQAGLVPVSLTITGGESVSSEGLNYRVPKRDLISRLEVLLETRRLQIAEGLSEIQTLLKEFESFRRKIKLQTGNDIYGVWRAGEHDDEILSLALACWYGETGTVPQVRARIL